MYGTDTQGIYPDTSGQVRIMLSGYFRGILDRSTIEDILGIGKSRFFALLKYYRQAPNKFSLDYHRDSPARLPASTETEIEKELIIQKGLVEDSSLPITSYNYSAIRDRLAERRITVALSTIIERAKGLDCYVPHPKQKAHDREVVTAAIGTLIQHDASHHRWSPYAGEKWVLITSIDDFSRKLLYAGFFEQEITWAHIRAAETLIGTYGISLRYYVDSLRVFRFVQGRDSPDDGN